jgi:hypothetical protein
MAVIERDPFGRWMSIHGTGSAYSAVCDLCNWASNPRTTAAEARRLARNHADARRHREDADAYSRSERRA